MALSKQAKILTKPQADAVLSYLNSTRYPVRNRAIFLLSLKAGLRAKEIASLTWEMVTDAEGNLGDAIHLTDIASKGRSGRVVPLNKELRAALEELKAEADQAFRPSPYIVTSERGGRTSAAAIVNKFACWYRTLEPIQKDWIHEQRLARDSLLSMRRIIARRMKASTLVA